MANWRWGKEKSTKNLNKEIVGYITGDGEYRIVQKMRTSGKVIKSLIDSKSVSSRRGTAEVEKLFEKKIFSFPKPVSLIKDLLISGSSGNDIILDFFSGSASTAHAVMQLNAEDDGNRKHIQVQLPEPIEEKSEAYKAGYKTLTEIGKERIRRAAKKIAQENPEKVKDLDLGFKVFKLDSSNIKAWDGALKDQNGQVKDLGQMLEESVGNIKQDRSQEDVLYEILLKYGLDLSLPIAEKTIAGESVYNIGAGALFICLADTITTAIAEGIGQWKKELRPEVCRVVFKDSGFTDVEKTNSIQILKRYGIDEVRSI